MLVYNRSRGLGGEVPSPEQIVEARGNLSQREASALVYTGQQRWSMYESGKTRMHPGIWELFKIKRGLQ